MVHRGHQFIITARDKQVSYALLELEGILYIMRGEGIQTHYLGKSQILFHLLRPALYERQFSGHRFK
jgi:predicted glycosyltransferase